MTSLKPLKLCFSFFSLKLFFSELLPLILKESMATVSPSIGFHSLSRHANLRNTSRKALEWFFLKSAIVMIRRTPLIIAATYKNPKLLRSVASTNASTTLTNVSVGMAPSRQTVASTNASTTLTNVSVGMAPSRQTRKLGSASSLHMIHSILILFNKKLQNTGNIMS